MSKQKRKIDQNQMAFDFDKRIEEYQEMKVELLRDRPVKCIESHEEACVELAAACKRAIRQCGLSREQVVDEINAYFGLARNPGRKLSIHMFNHYLSKPALYPLPAYLIFALQHITKSLEPLKALADAEEARVISGDEVRQMALGKLDDTILEMQRIKKELRGRR